MRLVVDDFYNNLVNELHDTFFPDHTVQNYSDWTPKYLKIRHTVELFSNGCLTYGSLITKLTKLLGEDKEVVEAIVNKYLTNNQ